MANDRVYGLGAQVERFEAFLDEHGSVLANCVQMYVDRMRETAAGAKAASEAPPDESPRTPTPGTIDITPGPAAWRQMARAFTESADKAEAAGKALAVLIDGDEDESDGNDQPLTPDEIAHEARYGH